MAIAGLGCFVAWHDLQSGREADHDHWHTHEHMIERVAIPGFLRGFRYRSVAGSPRVCTMYQVESVSTLTSPAYLERLNNPTPWSKQILPLFVGMNRTLCTVASTHGHGIGGHLLTIQLAPIAGENNRLRDTLSERVLPELAARRGLCGAHLLIGDQAASQMRTQEKALRGEPDAVADWIVLIEGYDSAEVAAARSELAATLPAHGGAPDMVSGLYTFDFALGQ
ncbi:MAG TPA: hypothetical protein VF051_06255, partial [Hyphomicrobiaceae bacterium]